MIRYLDQLTAIDVAEAVALWLDGFDTAEIAADLGTNEHVIYNNLPRWRAAVKAVAP